MSTKSRWELSASQRSYSKGSSTSRGRGLARSLCRGGGGVQLILFLFQSEVLVLPLTQGQEAGWAGAEIVLFRASVLAGCSFHSLDLSPSVKWGEVAGLR